jgi:hypothetical protein
MNGRDLTLTRDGANPIGTISAASAIDNPPSRFTSSWVVREYVHVEAHESVKAKIPKEAKEKSELGCQDSSEAFPGDGSTNIS